MLFYGLMTLGAIVSFPVNDAAVVARCRPVIARWASRAEELYPSNQCLTRLRCLILAHLDGPSHDALSSSAKTPAGATTAAGAAHSATA